MLKNIFLFDYDSFVRSWHVFTFMSFYHKMLMIYPTCLFEFMCELSNYERKLGTSHFINCHWHKHFTNKSKQGLIEWWWLEIYHNQMTYNTALTV